MSTQTLIQTKDANPDPTQNVSLGPIKFTVFHHLDIFFGLCHHRCLNRFFFFLKDDFLDKKNPSLVLLILGCACDLKILN